RPFVVVDDIRRDADARFRQTERELTERLQQTERRLRELRQGQGGAQQQGAAVITAEQRAEIDAARAQILQTRQQLRAVQLDLRRDIEGMEVWMRIINIAAVPLLLAVFAIGLGIARSRRRSAARS
ncbi:MAG TPA: ABC transporter, partial [Roseomonas sp.]|nr:ABC transporter [Roseomonas sp.]